MTGNQPEYEGQNSVHFAVTVSNTRPNDLLKVRDRFYHPKKQIISVIHLNSQAFLGPVVIEPGRP